MLAPLTSFETRELVSTARLIGARYLTPISCFGLHVLLASWRKGTDMSVLGFVRWIFHAELFLLFCPSSFLSRFPPSRNTSDGKQVSS